MSAPVPFALYHGTSSLYLKSFVQGMPPMPWPHRTASLQLLQHAWAALRKFGSEPPWWIESIIAQKSGVSNWQHGSFYVTPSRQSAVRYAATGSSFGGELLTLCKQALDELGERDGIMASELMRNAGPLSPLLSGTGQPILVELNGIYASDLAPETDGRELSDMLVELSQLDASGRDLRGQQANFSLKDGRGVIARLFKVNAADPDDPLTDFELEECRT